MRRVDEGQYGNLEMAFFKKNSGGDKKESPISAVGDITSAEVLATREERCGHTETMWGLLAQCIREHLSSSSSQGWTPG